MLKNFIFFLIFSSSFLSAEIIEIHSLNVIEQELDQQNKNSLVIFDIDYVLLIPKDKILRYCCREVRQKLFPNVLTDKTEETLYSQMLFQADEELLEPIAVQLIKSLQERGVPVMALTGRWAMSGGIHWEQLRAEMLKEQGINLKNIADKNSLVLHELSHNGPSPVYKDGILFTNRYSKGEVIKAFLNHLKTHPAQIVFIDDQKENLLSVESSLSDSGIKFLGVRDLFVKDLNETCSPKLAEAQVNYLRKTGKWLSDKEAQESLSEL
jgi:hypothetical protein